MRVDLEALKRYSWVFSNSLLLSLTPVMSIHILQKHLFETTDESGNVIAPDLATTNINRGRDMALPAYYKYRGQLDAIRSFFDEECYL